MDDSSPNRRGMMRMWAAAAILAASSLAGCTGFKGTTAKSFLKQIDSDPDPNERFLAYQKLASPNCYDDGEQKATAVRMLVKKLEEGKEPVATRAVICRTLGDLKDKQSREILIKMISDNDAIVRVQACRALGKVGNPEDGTILVRVMTMDGLEDCRIAAIEGLGDLKPHDSRILEMLIGGMENDDPAIRLASVNALKSITRKNAGVDPAEWRKALTAELQTPPELPVANTPPVQTHPIEEPSYPPKPRVPAALLEEPKGLKIPE
ncbi:HEAT repeat domain-containing protein [Singulisphaera sp. PoT]|uniref:HEAT repeat domain-containing protein n=1 Tax=Singulisphaera sp. PoT TaxID=3411797 RepID=UPI003BF5ACE5